MKTLLIDIHLQTETELTETEVENFVSYCVTDLQNLLHENEVKVIDQRTKVEECKYGFRVLDNQTGEYCEPSKAFADIVLDINEKLGKARGERAIKEDK